MAVAASATHEKSKVVAQECASTSSNHQRRERRWRKKLPRGWRFGILNGFGVVVIALIINIALCAAAAASRADPNDDGSSEKALWQGDCDKARQLNIGIHLVINILSTLMLSASNYAIQCLWAPTRAEIDAAHAQRFWLHIGVLSPRNIRKISAGRVFLGLLLATSSLPLHLL